MERKHKTGKGARLHPPYRDNETAARKAQFKIDHRDQTRNSKMSFDPKKMLEEQQEARRSQRWLLTKVHEFNQAHNSIKHTVHTAWRYPLPPWGRFVMGCFYFSLPVAGGYYLMAATVSKSDLNLEARLGDVSDSSDIIKGSGQHTIRRDGQGEREEKVGAGGWGGGVHLANSDSRTQEVNRINLERFLKKQRRLKEKRERAAQKAVSTEKTYIEK